MLQEVCGKDDHATEIDTNVFRATYGEDFAAKDTVFLMGLIFLGYLCDKCQVHRVAEEHDG